MERTCILTCMNAIKSLRKMTCCGIQKVHPWKFDFKRIKLKTKRTIKQIYA